MKIFGGPLVLHCAPARSRDPYFGKCYLNSQLAKPLRRWTHTAEFQNDLHYNSSPLFDNSDLQSPEFNRNPMIASRVIAGIVFETILNYLVLEGIKYDYYLIAF